MLLETLLGSAELLLDALHAPLPCAGWTCPIICAANRLATDSDVHATEGLLRNA
jgi:hypothetical protein